MCTASTHPLTLCALCLNPTAPEALDFVGVLAGPDVPVCVGCLGELSDVAESHHRAAREAQEFAVSIGVADVLFDHQLDALRDEPVEGDELPWEQDIALMSFIAASPVEKVA